MLFGGRNVLGRRGAAAAVGTLAALSTLVGTPSAAVADPPDLPAADSNSITVVDPNDEPTQVDLDDDGVISGSEERLIDVTMTTQAIFRPEPGSTPAIDPVTIPIRVRIYLPADYQPGRAEPYDVLYLLHGGDGDYDDWSQPASTGGSAPDGGDVVSIVDAQTAFDGIVVMPEGGDAGWYSDWFGYSTGNFQPDWETFHLDQLVPWVDANFNTSGTAVGRAIAGLSMGGFGTLKYAGTNPGMFSAIGSFSGPADLRNEAFQFVIAGSMNGAGVGRGAAVGAGDGADGYDFSGSAYLVSGDEYDPIETAPLGPETGWAAINPVQLADDGAYDDYAGNIYLYSGESNPLTDIFEYNIRQTTDDLHEALDAVDHRYCRGPGVHQWSYWRNDLEDFLANVYGSGSSGCTDNPGGWVEVP